MNNREKWSTFKPCFVYRCPCLIKVIEKSFLKDCKSFLQIHDEVFTFVLEHGLHRVFTTKCGENLKDCIFCCEEHASIMVYGLKKFDCTAQPSFETLRLQMDSEDLEKTFCKYCVKYYLRKTFCYFKSIKFN